MPCFSTIGFGTWRLLLERRCIPPRGREITSLFYGFGPPGEIVAHSFQSAAALSLSWALGERHSAAGAVPLSEAAVIVPSTRLTGAANPVRFAAVIPPS